MTRGADVRRVAFWFHVEIPRLGLDPHRILRGPGLYHGNTAGKASRVASYRYPQRGLAPGVPTRLGGPEQVFRFTLRRPVANFGAVVVRKAPGVRVSPRLVTDNDENRVVGYTGIPARLNPYEGFYRGEPVVGAVLPEPRTYEFVFDTPTRAKPGAFVFRFWVDDTSPPSIRILGHKDRIGRPIRVAVRDSGSGVDPHSLKARVGGRWVRFRYDRGVLLLRTKGLRPGRQALMVSASDYQEAKNMEDVGPVLPNTRVLHTNGDATPLDLARSPRPVSSLPQKLDLALVTRLRQVVAGEVATEAELRALDDEAGGWLRATDAQLRAAEDRLTKLNADPAAPLAEIATEVRRAEALCAGAGRGPPADRRAGTPHARVTDGVAQASRRCGLTRSPRALTARRSWSSVVGRLARSRSTLAANSSASSSRTTRRLAFRLARCRRRRESTPNR